MKDAKASHVPALEPRAVAELFRTATTESFKSRGLPRDLFLRPGQEAKREQETITQHHPTSAQHQNVIDRLIEFRICITSCNEVTKELCCHRR